MQRFSLLLRFGRRHHARLADAIALRDGRQRQARIDLKLFLQSGFVGADRLVTDRQLLGDGLIGAPFADQLQHRQFPRR
ncbi:hypothetical protein D9M71_459130 [compost metagenome]